MNMTFKALAMGEWTVLDDKIICNKGTIPINQIKDFSHTPAKSRMINGIFTFHYSDKYYVLAYDYKFRDNAIVAAEYVLKNSDKEAYELRKKVEEEISKDIRMRCNVCGKVFCYTIEDLLENVNNAKNARSSALLGVAHAFVGTEIGMYANQNSADRYLDKIKDYARCPSCGSRDIVRLSDDDLAQMQSGQVQTQSVSPADELKKFKELLDDGVITQEEFDAKKKQLLGL